MPIYEYLCDACGEITDTVCKFEEKPKKMTCKCGKKAGPCMSSPAQVKISLDANGYKGYRINLGDGRKVARSATREKYEHQIGNTAAGKASPKTATVFTKARQQHEEKTEKAKQRQFIHDFKKRTAKC